MSNWRLESWGWNFLWRQCALQHTSRDTSHNFLFLVTLVFSLVQVWTLGTITVFFDAQHVNPFPELVSSQETPCSLAAVVFACQRPVTDGNGMQPLSDLKHGDTMANFAGRFLPSENVSWSMFQSTVWNCRGVLDFQRCVTTITYWTIELLRWVEAHEVCRKMMFEGYVCLFFLGGTGGREAGRCPCKYIHTFTYFM